MYDVESGSYEASVEARGRYICIGLFTDETEAARARDIGMIRMIGFERASRILSLDISNYDVIGVKELRQFDEILENEGAELEELPDDPANKFGYSDSSVEHSSGKANGKTVHGVRPVFLSKATGAIAPVARKSELNDEDILQIREMGKFQPDWVYEEWLPVEILKINTRHGRVSLSVCFLKSKAGFKVFKELIAMGSYSRKELANLPIWSIEISENQEDEDRVPGHGYCGYLAMDQILNRWPKCVNIETQEGQECVIGTMERLIGHEDVHPNGRLAIPPVIGPVREDVMALMKEISENSNPISLPRARWMSGGMVNNLCPTQKFSRWVPASNGMLQLIESQFDSRCHYLTDNEC